jgi:hypothetical protein
VVAHKVVSHWIPPLALGATWNYQRYDWLSLFYVLLVTQAGHFLDHVAQMIQIHLLGLQGTSAQGGLVGGGLRLIRPDLDFLYNLIETGPPAIAFFWQARRIDAARAVTPSSGQPAGSLASAVSRS